MNFLSWNYIIAKYFFNPEKAGKEVLLYITKNEIARLGVKHLNFISEEESWEDYCDVISKGLRNGGRRKLFSENIKFSIDEWDKYSKWIYEKSNQHPFEIDDIPVTDPDTGVTYPFFIAFIPLLVIPFTESTNGVRANSYYAPLSDYLKNNNITTQREDTPSFSHIDPLWSQLEKWSKEYCKTDLGIFTERQFGNPNWRYVGKPFSQCIITPKNIRDIPNMFWEADIAPFSFVPDTQLQRMIIRYGQKHCGFNPRITEIMNDQANPLRTVIIDIVRREYENWEGEVIQYDDHESTVKPKSGWFYGTLLSSITLDGKNEEIAHSYHLYSKNDFPDDLSFNGTRVMHLVNGYSEKIKHTFDQGIEWTDKENKWKATPTKSEIILYASGAYCGLSNDIYIETSKISRITKMYLLCPVAQGKSMEDWGSNFKPGQFKKIDFDNIPGGYLLYSFQNPPVEHPTEQLLKFQKERKIEFKGGIKVGNREFLNALLPVALLSGADGTEKLYLEYTRTQEKVFLESNSAVPEEYFLPVNIKLDNYFIIKSDPEDSGLDIPYCIVEGSFSPLDIIEENLAKRNKRGELSLPDETEYVRGSNVTYKTWPRQLASSLSFLPNEYNRCAFQPLHTGYDLSNGNLILEFLTQKRNSSYEDFSIVMELVANASHVWEDRLNTSNPKYIKQQSINYYDYSGFLDYDYSLDRITINKPQVVIIPSKQSVEAILIGGRSQKFVDELLSECHDAKITVKIVPQQNQLARYLVPDTIKLIPCECDNSTQAWMSLKKLAGKMDIAFYTIDKPYAIPQIVQFGLQDFSENLKGYKAHLIEHKSVDIKDIAWARKTFNPDTLVFEKDPGNLIDKNLSLQEYYLQYKFKYIFWLNGISYDVDRSWGKFLLLGELKKNVIFYSDEKKILAIPKFIHMPRLIAESITLLSGLTPSFRKLNISGTEQIYQLYQNVPKLFAENLFQKFNQQLQNHNLI
jgi:hypothetical protein